MLNVSGVLHDRISFRVFFFLNMTFSATYLPNISLIFGSVFILWLFLTDNVSASGALTPVSQEVNCLQLAAECTDSGRVCGTDGRTYHSRCHLLRAACSDEGLAIAHSGSCSQKQPCWAHQGGEGLLGGIGRDDEGDVDSGHVFKPKCLSDGRYAPVQCHDATGYCWCVTAQGKPVPNTSVRGARPKCNRRGKLFRNGGLGKSGRPRKGCSRPERSLFMNKLINGFNIEFHRTKDVPKNATNEEKEKQAVEWKFASLDADSNGTLSKAEYGPLRRLVRKAVKPFKCARSFTRYCDTNRDALLSKLEWTTCLRKSNATAKKEKKKKTKSKLIPDEDQYSQGFNGVPAVAEGVTLLTPTTGEDFPEAREEPDAVDCLSDRKSVLDEQLENRLQMYVPECAPDGRYNKIQCYNSTGYCWCVDEDTGKPIPGTSVRDPNPRCDAVQPPSRPMKGCPQHRKRLFLKELIDFFRESMNKHQNSGQIAQLPSLAESPSDMDQTVIVWYFHYLDANKNKVLERREWKSLTASVSQQKRLERCGRKLPRHCDVNHDRRISMTEWFHCLDSGAVQSDQPPKSTSPLTGGKRRGPNPLESFLINDD